MKDNKQPVKKHFFAIIFIAAALLLWGCKTSLKLLNTAPVIPTVEGAFYVGTDSCITCHDDVYVQYKN